MTEDELIAEILAPLAGGPAHALDDDCAHIPPGQLAAGAIVTMDTLVAGVHFFADDPPGLVAKKALRVNLSDLAAKAARPRGYLLSLALPKECGADWVRAFASGLAEDQSAYDVSLWGGDTVSTPGPLTITITAIGTPSDGGTPLRSGARAGDAVMVTGTIGDAALGLKALSDADFAAGLTEDERQTLIGRYRLPDPRVGFLDTVAASVTAAMDVSDGLVLDLSRMAAASGCGAELDLVAVPLSSAVARLAEGDESLREAAATGGDDYEILFTVAEAALPALDAHAAASGLAVTRVGTMTHAGGLRILDGEGREVHPASLGYRHM